MEQETGLDLYLLLLPVACLIYRVEIFVPPATCQDWYGSNRTCHNVYFHVACDSNQIPNQAFTANTGLQYAPM